MSDLPVSIRGRFKRSVDLVRDFHTAPNIEGYVVTPTAQKVLGQVQEALSEDRPERAWTLTGPYGGGKSAFALFAAHVLRGTPEAIEHLRSADTALADGFEVQTERPFCPVLVAGSRQPLQQALLQGLADSVERFADDIDDDKSESVQALRSITEEARQHAEERTGSDEDVAELFVEAAEAVQSLTGGGLYVLVDELGKMLEYAATRPEEGDIFVLQLLAERASRTAGSDQAPLLLTTILHQAFERYATHLDQVQRQEWQKVQGRFEDIAYVEPADATLRLLAEAIQVKGGESLVDAHGEVVSEVIEAANLPKRFDEDETEALLRQSLPLHPTVGLIVGPLFQRLAQNERSLFAFLAAGEPGGFLDVMQGGTEGGDSLPLYRLDHLYDYLLTTLGAILFNQDTSKLWAETEAAFGRLKDQTPLSEQLLKQIALLNFAGEMSGLTATTALLKATADAPAEEVEEELQRLVDDRVVVYRSYNDSYRIWQGSDVDIEEEIEKARSQVPGDVSLAELLRDVLPPSPVAAYRHSYETGTTRTFDVMYASGGGWEDALEDRREDADGHILYVLPESETDGNRLAIELQEAAADPMLFIAVPDGVGTLRNTVFELKCVDWVGSKVEEIEGDEAARRELRERRTYLENRIDMQLNRLLVADEDGENPCQWFHDGDTFRIDGRRELQDRLSAACDATFTKTPEIRNELLNLREPSPSAVRGQKKLLEAMVIGNDEEGRDPTEENLGIEGTPAEYGLYVSIVRATGMHRETDEGTWAFFPPYEEKNPGCYAVWKHIEERFEGADGRRVSLDEFFDFLTDPPYGVRQGLIPVFLFAFFKVNEDEIAVYENGTFLQEIDYGTLERLLKSPEKFDFQRVTISGTREEVLRRLAPLVGLSEEERKPLPFVLRLLQQVRGLPPYVKKNSRMSEEAMAVREALYRSSDPTVLLFEELPNALNIGVDSFLDAKDVEPERAELFVRELQKALREITSAYDDLIRDIQDRVAAAFELRADSVEDRRHELAERARELEPHASDPDVKSFIIRATNEVLDTQAWYESIASLIAGKPPVKWLDGDLEDFEVELREVAKTFRHQETLIFEGAQEETKDSEESDTREEMRLHRIRLGITKLGEPERETVVNIHPEDEDFVETVAERVRSALEHEEDDGDTSSDIVLVALGRVMERLVDEREQALNPESTDSETHERR
jgi:hypothetical protein